MPCTNARDTITQAAGRVLANHFDYPDSEHVVTSYCRTADGTWIGWYTLGLGDATGVTDGDPKGDTDKSHWPALIASANAVGVGFFPDDGSGPIVYGLGVDPIFTWNNGPTGRGETTCGYWFIVGDVFELWGKPQLTGWSMNVLDVKVRTDGSNVWVAVLAQEAVKYPFLSNVEHIDRCAHAHASMEELWADRGFDAFVHDWDASSYFWLYDSGVGGGTPSLFPGVPYDDTGPVNRSLRWHPARVTVFAGDTGGFTKLDTIDAKFDNFTGVGGFVSGIEAAASPAEPGILHLLWSEGGKFGSKDINEQRGQRVNYSRWSSTAKTLDTDLLYESADGYPADASGDMPDGQFVFTSEMILRNDHGSPIAIVWPWPTSAAPSSIAQFWDLSTGTAEVLQTLNPSLVPTGGEGLPGGGVLNGSLAHGIAPPGRSQFASSLYTDPTLDNQDVYLICASYTDLVAFYRIPVDGSATFDFLDGKREVGYSIVDNAAGAFGVDFGADFVSDPDNVWMPSGGNGGGGVMHLTRRCIPTWELLPAFPVPDPASGYEEGAWTLRAAGVPALVTDDAGDWIAGGGTGPQQTILSVDPTNIAALRAKICRCCVPCGPVEIHAWHKIS